MATNYQGEEVFKNVMLRLTDEKDAETFNRFKLLLLTKSASVESVIMGWIKQYVKRNDVKFNLVLQARAMEDLEQEGLPTTRVTLVKYRDLGLLVDEYGLPFWYTDGDAIAYNYDELKKFIAKRKEAGVERLVP